MKIITRYNRAFGDMGFGQVGISTEVEKQLGRLVDENGVPIIRFWFDPREKFSRAHLTMRNRAGTGERYPANNGPTSPAWSHTTAINDTPTITTTNTWFGPLTFAEPEYTFISTIRPRVPAGTNMSIISPVGTGTYGPNLAMQSNGSLRVYNGPNVTVRLFAAPDTSLFDTNMLLGTSFSQENGIAMLKNSSILVSNPADKNAPDATTMRFLGATTNGGQFEGDVGICMLIAADLTRGKWQYANELIHGYLSDQSGIALA